MKTAIVIPARYASTRFPNKMLKDQTGWPLIRHVYERAKQVKNVATVLVATDHDDILSAVKGFGGTAEMTDVNHPSGSDRIAEVAKKYLGDHDLIINVQGDEPEMDPRYVEDLMALYAEFKPFMGTLVVPFPADKTDGAGSPLDPNCVKAVLGTAKKTSTGMTTHQALYFSRALAPYPRDDKGAVTNGSDYYLHLGIYAYAPADIQRFVSYPMGRLENIEKLEQLRALENGHTIVAGVVDKPTNGIDTAEQYAEFVARWKASN